MMKNRLMMKQRRMTMMKSTVMSETGFWQSRQDRDFQNHNPFFETGIETLKTPIPFSRLGSRLSICQSLFRDWDRDFQNVNHFFETGIETNKLEGITVIETGIETFNSKCNGIIEFFKKY